MLHLRTTLLPLLVALVSGLAGGNALAQALTAAQQKEANQIVRQVEGACLKGVEAAPAADSLVKQTLQWSREPAVCGCVAMRLRAKLTPAVFTQIKEQSNSFWQDFADSDVMECTVPTIKARFGESCEEVLGDAFATMSNEKVKARLAALGYADLPALLSNSCSCIRGAIKDITPQQWVASSMAAYQDYLERKRTGKPTAKGPDTPLESAMDTCLRR